MSRYRMYKYVLEPLEENERWDLRIWMCDTYSPILQDCFPHISFNFRSGPSGTCKSVLSLKHNQVLSLQNLLEIFKTHWLLVKNDYIAPYFSDELDQCIALDFNFEENKETGGYEYTKYGRLEHLAKENQNAEARAGLVDVLSNLCNNHPSYNKASIIIPIPPNPSKTFHLPVEIVRELSGRTGKIDGTNMIHKIKETRRFKDLSINEKCDELRESITITGDVRDKDVIIIDDLYQSGFTMWTVAQLLKNKGAKKVFGLACVKSLRDTDNI